MGKPNSVLSSRLLSWIANCARAQSVRPPPQSQWDQATAAIAGTDAAAQIKTWINGGWASQDLWREWLQSLARAGRHRIGWAAGGIAASLEARVRGGLIEEMAGDGGGGRRDGGGRPERPDPWHPGRVDPGHPPVTDNNVPRRSRDDVRK
jgi:hypothetical protein